MMSFRNIFNYVINSARGPCLYSYLKSVKLTNVKKFILECPGEELNFLTTIFSRTLYHLSYRDFRLGIVGIEPTYVLFQVKCFTSQPYTLIINLTNRLPFKYQNIKSIFNPQANYLRPEGPYP